MKTLTDIYTDIVNELKLQFGLTEVGKTVEAFAMVHAVSLYLYLKDQQEVQKNFNPETAYSEAFGGTLEAFGRRVLGREPNPATTGNYNLTVTGSSGGTITAGKVLRDSDNNLFEVQSTVVLTGTTGTINVESLSAGTDYLLAVSDVLYFTEPIANVNKEATVSSVETSPVDAETSDEYKDAIVAFEKIEPQGGSAADYRIWGFDGDGVVNIFSFTGDIPGDIYVYVEGNTSNGVPTQTVLDDVAAVIELNPDTTVANRGRRPLGGFNVFVQSIAPINVDIDILNLIDDSATVISTITSAVNEFLSDIRPAVDGADDPNESKSVLSLGDINTVVKNSLDVGNTFDNITIKVAGTEISTYEFTGGSIPYLNSVNAI